MPRIDCLASTVTVNHNGIIIVDGIPIVKVVIRNREPYLQFIDKNHNRCAMRGSEYVEVPLDAFFAKIIRIIERRDLPAQKNHP